ncbi:MAG TPA: hypothetical protein VEA16_09235 [Vicinamibacterales bacterium]|nr:hypothetical protein [Vicinamibacterales bacterium]
MPPSLFSLPEPRDLASILAQGPNQVGDLGDDVLQRPRPVELFHCRRVSPTRLGHAAECACGWFELFDREECAWAAPCPVEDELRTSRARRRRVLDLLQS